MFVQCFRYVLPTPVLLAVLLILNPLCAFCAWGNPVQTRPNELSALKTLAEKLEKEYGEDISKLAEWSGFDEALLYAIVLVESEGNPDALNKSGARGLGQVKPEAETEAGCTEAHEPAGNLACMANYLTVLRDKEKLKTVAKILLGYRLGPTGAREAIKENPRVLKNHRYVTKVLKTRKVLASLEF